MRFIQQYEHSSHNYTAERDKILPDWDAAELTRQMKSLTSPCPSNSGGKADSA